MKKLCTEKLYANLTYQDTETFENKMMGETVVHFLRHITGENMCITVCMFQFLYHFIFPMDAGNHKQEKWFNYSTNFTARMILFTTK